MSRIRNAVIFAARRSGSVVNMAQRKELGSAAKRNIFPDILLGVWKRAHVCMRALAEPYGVRAPYHPVTSYKLLPHKVERNPKINEKTSAASPLDSVIVSFQPHSYSVHTN